MIDEHEAVVAAPAEQEADDESTSPAPEWTLLVVVLLLATLADATLYRARGFAGPALFFLVVPWAMYAAAQRRRLFGAAGLFTLLLGLLAVKLVWCGAAIQVAVGFALLAGVAMAFSGQRPYVLRTLVFVSQTVMSGYAALYRQWEAVRLRSPRLSRVAGLGVLLPVLAVLAFGTLFVLANPDLAANFGAEFVALTNAVGRWFREDGPRPAEIAFWSAAGWIAIGALRPLMRETLARQGLPGEERETVSAIVPVRDPLFVPHRNMLVAVVILFAAYLVFEFRTLWFREFPEGFHYSGYAHRGAFWLTVSLALATAVLSLVFRGGLLDDPRIRSLRRLAWTWSALNLLLAVAVYNRLSIYVGFNGMTRMRVIGLLGISAVVVGFVLVLVKIAARHDFVWVVRRQLWALAGFVFLYAVLPVDGLVTRYNVARILAGDPAPAVQISRHPIDAEGLLQLPPLLESDVEPIRDGIRALLAERREEFEDRAAAAGAQDWSAFQWSESLLRQEFARLDAELDELADPQRREDVRRRFDEYAFRWW
jgi:hypothetical protein